MAYKVLYRKYRPENFENIVGQEYIKKTLKNSIINHTISHAYIFSGPRGTGKTTTAKVFAKSINCLSPLECSPCGKCEFCTNFQDNPDIIEIDAASNNGVDEIRMLIDNVKLTPTNGKYKVYIIDEVHMLTQSAFNALLLTLEEPPAHTIFILATTNVENVPITILSRCQRFDFQKIQIEALISRLKSVANEEKIAITDDALREISYLSEGCLRDALSLLDQLSKNPQEITLDLVENQIKSISLNGINELLDCIEENNVNKCLDLISEYRNRALDYKALVKKIIDIASKRAKDIKKTGKYKKLYYLDYKNIVIELADTLSKTNLNVDSYTILEMILISYFDCDEENIKKDPVLENKSLQNDANSPKNAPKREEVQSTNLDNEEKTFKKLPEIDLKLIELRINNCFANAQKKYLEQAKQELADYSMSINASGKIKSIILDSTVVAASDKNLILTCSNEHNVIPANSSITEIEVSFNKETNKNYHMIFLTESEWLKEKEKYITNLKSKKIYTYIEEANNNSNDNIEINTVFDISKVEII